MTERATNIRKPRTDGLALWDLLLGMLNYNAVSVAHNLKLFDLLRGGPRTLSEICDATGRSGIH